MKILFVTNMPPAYPTNGAVIQTYHFMRILLKNHQVGLWTYSTDGRENVDLGPLAPELSFIHVEPKTPSKDFSGKLHRWWRWLSGVDPMARWSYMGDRVQASLEDACNQFSPDVIMFEQLHMSFPILAFAKKTKRPILAFNAHDAIQVVLARSFANAKGKLLTHILNQRFLKVIKQFETEIVKAADIVFSVSPVDARHLRTHELAKNWAITPNGVDTEYYQPLPEAANLATPTMVFVGSLSYGPNIEAIKFYVEKIHNKVRERFPHAMLKIIGEPTNETKKWENIKGIEFVGFHRDFRSIFANAHVSIVPLLSGSGTRFKILESWAMGRAIVSTNVGAEGLAYKGGENILIADDPDKFAEAIGRLFEDERLRKKLAASGRKLVEAQYSWNSIVEVLERKLSAVCEKVSVHAEWSSGKKSRSPSLENS